VKSSILSPGPLPAKTCAVIKNNRNRADKSVFVDILLLFFNKNSITHVKHLYAKKFQEKIHLTPSPLSKGEGGNDMYCRLA
jgi:hypothetical protein